MKRKLKITAADGDIRAKDDETLENELSNIEDDFDYIVAGIEKLQRDGNIGFALDVCGHLNQAFTQIIEEIVDSISE